MVLEKIRGLTRWCESKRRHCWNRKQKTMHGQHLEWTNSWYVQHFHIMVFYPVFTCYLLPPNPWCLRHHWTPTGSEVIVAPAASSALGSQYQSPAGQGSPSREIFVAISHIVTYTAQLLTLWCPCTQRQPTVLQAAFVMVGRCGLWVH